MSSSDKPDARVEQALAGFRDEITALDERLVDTVNARLAAVRALHDYKERHGIAFLDPEREAWLAAHLRRRNTGPLSDEAVEELCAFVLGLVKREVAGR